MQIALKLLSFAAITIIAVLVFTSDLPRLILQGDIEALRQEASNNRLQMLFLTFLVMLLQNLITVVPLILLVTVNTALFGFTYGYVWSWLSGVSAALVVFLLTRYWLQHWLMSKINPDIKDRIERNGLAYVLVCRLIPVMPSSLINMTAGVSTIRFTHYVIGTLLGNLLYLSALAAVTLGIMTAGWEAAALCLAALAAAGGWYFVRRRRRRLQAAGRSSRRNS